MVIIMVACLTVISTITRCNNNKIIFNYNDDAYVTTLTNKSYNGEELASSSNKIK